ncbi:MAG: GNAT family N-acetyltransferase [Burkholderiales bacterium]|nr:GNAT family N-acetyltransferase [Burkholderiales bacterium]
MAIRSYTDTDFPAILHVYACSKLDELRFENRTFELVPLDEDTGRLAKFQDSDVLVFDDGVVRGYGAYNGSEIRSLFVHPQARGRKIGVQLLQAMLANIRGSATLNVAKSNRPAIQLYEQNGFSTVAEFVASYNGTIVAALTMSRTG